MRPSLGASEIVLQTATKMLAPRHPSVAGTKYSQLFRWEQLSTDFVNPYLQILLVRKTWSISSCAKLLKLVRDLHDRNRRQRTTFPGHASPPSAPSWRVPRGKASRLWKGRNGWPTGPAAESEISRSGVGCEPAGPSLAGGAMSALASTGHSACQANV